MNTSFRSFLAAFTLLFCYQSFAQNNVGIGTATPNAKSILELNANDKGFLMPRMTTLERNALGAGLALGDKGMLVFDTADNHLYFWDGTAWVGMPDGDGVTGNEYNTAFTYNSTTGQLSLTDGGGTFNVNLGGNNVVPGIGLVGTLAGTTLTLDAQAINGLHTDAAADAIKLGGALVENTLIDLNTFDLIENVGTGKYEIQNSGTPTFTVTPNSSIGINTSTTNAKAILEINSTTKGILVPKMTTVQRDAIATPPLGLIVYNITDSVAQHWNGICWLSMFRESCDECGFNITRADSLGVITKTTTDTTGTDITVTQTNGTIQPISLFLMHNLPAGAVATLSAYAINGSGTSHLTVSADIFTAPGSYPVAIQAACGSMIKTVVFIVQIDSCYKVYLNSNYTNYDLQAINALPSSVPICVIATVQPAGKLYGQGAPAFDSGNLHAQSHVGIVNMGEIYGDGGDGGAGGNFSTYGDPGQDGGDAINLTTRTTLNNTGFIFGGGGGGGSVALGVNIPVMGQLTVGAGGGGGAPDGLGGSTALAFLYDAGEDATGGINGNGGDGGLLNIPISIPLGAATVSITPNAYGGLGADYGQDGQVGSLWLNVQVQVPFLGTIFNSNLPNPPISNFPLGGIGGFAIRRNTQLLIGLPDGNYQTFSLRGQVGN